MNLSRLVTNRIRKRKKISGFLKEMKKILEIIKLTSSLSASLEIACAFFGEEFRKFF